MIDRRKAGFDKFTQENHIFMQDGHFRTAIILHQSHLSAFAAAREIIVG
ncbi:hypothetical protein [Sphingobium chlorophenolicum]|nr:hypothetical protein [Sphingobium chlorophenolicum]